MSTLKKEDRPKKIKIETKAHNPKREQPTVVKHHEEVVSSDDIS
jgi:hypothetical protein